MLLDIIKSRRSIRRYQDRPIEKDKLKKCLEAARYSPSACNSQPWRFVVIDDRDKKRKVCEIAFRGVYSFNKFAADAPVLIAAVIDRERAIPFLGGLFRKVNFALVDASIACQHLILQACELGLGSCWIGWFNEKPLKELLGIPAIKKVVALIALGYPAEETRTEKKYKTVDELISFNKW